MGTGTSSGLIRQACFAFTAALLTAALAGGHASAKSEPSATGCLPAGAAAQDPAFALELIVPGRTCLRRASPHDDEVRALGVEPAGFVDALAAYRAGHVEDGDALAARVDAPVARTALEWTALHQGRQISFARLAAFAAVHPDWPGSGWLRAQMESRLVGLNDPIDVLRFFVGSAPSTPAGKLALARALRATGRAADGTKLARAVFRESDLPPDLEHFLATEFGADLTKADLKYRSDRLFYRERTGLSLHDAARAGADVLALARARAGATGVAVPDAFRDDPTLVFARVQKLRHADKDLEAAHLIETAPHDSARLIDGDRWWAERRILARKLLDEGKVKAAYIMCAMATPVSREAKIDAEFHAGWIALRYLSEPARAGYHFAMAEPLAQTPTSIARIAYWQGRVAEESTDPGALAHAKAFYTRAAGYPASYYGQMAREALGLAEDLERPPLHAAQGDERAEAVRAVELLYAAGERDLATGLAMQAAADFGDPAQVGALADVITSRQDAHLALTVGKVVAQHGFPADELAFPVNGMPRYEALQDSAPAAVVLAVARQESAFQTGAVSKAGAKGLMQMIEATARQTARRAGVAFDRNRLVHDAAFNAKLGAAHLGALIRENGGSLVMSFAAYNAGGGRVQDWVEAYGDPRKPGVDAVDWVERIPFNETRDYVQRVVANVAVYSRLLKRNSQQDLVAQAIHQRPARQLAAGGL